jgi:hypothetical protein
MKKFWVDKILEGPVPWPKTVEEAVTILVDILPEEKLDFIQVLDPKDLARLHFGLGIFIRIRFGLWENSDLLRDCGKEQPYGDFIEPDGASRVIVEALHQRLNKKTS